MRDTDREKEEDERHGQTEIRKDSGTRNRRIRKIHGKTKTQNDRGSERWRDKGTEVQRDRDTERKTKGRDTERLIGRQETKGRET